MPTAAQIEAWNRAKWPPECIEAEQLNGRRISRLYALVGCPVQTPRGGGRLIDVHEIDNDAWCVVWLYQEPGIYSHFPPWEVTPANKEKCRASEANLGKRWKP